MTTKEQIVKAIASNKPELESFGIRNIGLFGSKEPIEYLKHIHDECVYILLESQRTDHR